MSGLALPARYDRRITRVMVAAAVTLVMVAIIAPVGMLLFAAVRTDSPGSPYAKWSLENLAKVYSTSAILEPLANTLLTCIPATAIAVLLGSVLAWLVHRTNAPGHRWLEPLLIVPIYFSPLSLAIGWIILAAPRIGLLNILWPFPGNLFNVYSIMSIILFMGLYYAPYVFLIMSGGLRSLDGGYEDASAILGARPARTLRSISLPMLRPQLLASTLLVFILSVSMFAEPALFGDRIHFVNLPLAVYRAILNVPADFGLAAAIGTVMLIGALAGFVLYRWALKSAERFVATQHRGFVNRRVDIGRLRPVSAVIATVYLLAVVVLPVLALAFASLIRFFGPHLSLTQFTFDQYARAIHNPLIADAIVNTLLLSFGVATVTTLFGFLVAYHVVRRGYGAVFVDAVSILPIGMPAIVLSLGFLWTYLWAPVGIYGTLWALMVALSTLIIPNTIRTLDAALRQSGAEAEFAARQLGAGTGRRMFQIVLPMIRGPLVSSWLLAFMLTTIQVSAPIVLRTPGQELLSVAVWSLTTDAGDINQASVAALVQAAIVGAVVLLARRSFRDEL
jgi:iron(III) transport system permease protein